MAVGAPLVISSNAAPLKWRPFSSCFNLCPLPQRYISLLSIACLSAHNVSVRLPVRTHMLTYMHVFTSFFLAHEREHTAIQKTHACKTKDAGTLGGDDMHCLFNHVLWDDSVIMLSSARFGTAKTGPPQHALLLAHNSTLQALTVKKRERISFFSAVFHLFFSFYHKHHCVETGFF